MGNRFLVALFFAIPVFVYSPANNQATADRIGRELGIDIVLAEVLPGQKALKIKELEDQGHKVGMVGDGINDAPALTQADVGFAFGAGTDVAMESAQVVLMKSDPYDVVGAIVLSRATLRKMHQNLWWAVGYNVVEAAPPVRSHHNQVAAMLDRLVVDDFRDARLRHLANDRLAQHAGIHRRLLGLGHHVQQHQLGF